MRPKPGQSPCAREPTSAQRGRVTNGLWHGAEFGYGRDMTQAGWPCGAERVGVLQRVTEHVLADAGEGVESSVLGAGGGVAPQPMDLAGLGGQDLEMSANDFLQTADRFRRVHIRTPLYSIHEPAVV